MIPKKQEKLNKEIRSDIIQEEVQHIRVSDWNGLKGDRKLTVLITNRGYQMFNPYSLTYKAYNLHNSKISF